MDKYREAHNRANRAWRKRNPDYYRRYRLAHLEEIKANDRAYRERRRVRMEEARLNNGSLP